MRIWARADRGASILEKSFLTELLVFRDGDRIGNICCWGSGEGVEVVVVVFLEALDPDGETGESASLEGGWEVEGWQWRA